MIISDKLNPLGNALSQPNGARFYRCALQVNPYNYHGRHGSLSRFANEAEYNSAIIQACMENNIDAIAVTDHYRIGDSWGLIKEARANGIFVFGGFEASSKDGVHFLCVYDPDNDGSIERCIGQFGIKNEKEVSPNGDKDCVELLECIKEQGGIAIAAHVCAKSGLLSTLEGGPRQKAWRSKGLYACAIPGGIEDTPPEYTNILRNKDKQHERTRPVAVINASDVNSPEDLAEGKSSCLIKMSELSVEGLRQAFLDPQSRIRLNKEAPLEAHTQIKAISWEGGFLDQAAIHFNENLNVLIGGRGTGKSTMIESIRYVLGIAPVGEDAKRSHDSMLKHVLKAGTKVSLLVRSQHPSPEDYIIERTYPNPPVAKDSNGKLLKLSPTDILPNIGIFGQHEISELTKSREKLTGLLERFIDGDHIAEATNTKMALALEKSRNKVLMIDRDLQAIRDRLSVLPSLVETEKRYQKAGLEIRLQEKTQFDTEQAALNEAKKVFDPILEIVDELDNLLPIETDFLRAENIGNPANIEPFNATENIITTTTKALSEWLKQGRKIVEDATKSIEAERTPWAKLQAAAEGRYQATLRELQKERIDGQEFIRLKTQMKGLGPDKKKLSQLEEQMQTASKERAELLDQWNNLQAENYRKLVIAAKRVTKKLRGKVKATVIMNGDKTPLEKLLRDEVGGNLSSVFERLNNKENLSLVEFARACMEGKEVLIEQYRLPSGAAEKLANAPLSLKMMIEEVTLPATTMMELNTSSDEAYPIWQTLEELSTGQKATAVLLLLLLEADAPLIVDQPEDDLDNRFITDVIVPTMKEEKLKRQFIFSSHNANIPVLGDAELIVGLTATLVGDTVQGQSKPEHMGSIDVSSVRLMVEEILEGGKLAFEKRREKYGF